MLGRGLGRLFRADLLLAVALTCACAIPAAALGANPAFPGTDPFESPRLNTPDDSDFDECEGDDRDGAQECATYFEEQYQLFGFGPDSAQIAPGLRTTYLDCIAATAGGDGQLDQQGEDANQAAEGSLLGRCNQTAPPGATT